MVHLKDAMGAGALSRGQRGFSLTELVVAMAVALILIAVGFPSFMRAYRTYQLSNAATQLADILRVCRYDAIRRNAPTACVLKPSTTDPGATAVWVDTDGNGVQNGSEKMILLGDGGNLADSGSVAGAANLVTQAVGSTGATAIPPTGATLTFDARGALNPPGVTVFYLASPSRPQTGYRGVVMTAAGSISIWNGDPSGTWQQAR